MSRLAARLEDPEEIAELLDQQTSYRKKILNVLEAGVVAFAMQHWMDAPVWAVILAMLVLTLLLGKSCCDGFHRVGRWRCWPA